MIETKTMPEQVKLTKVNESWGQVICFQGAIKNDLYEHYAIPMKDFQFTPKFRMGLWDGKIAFISRKDFRFPLGLAPDIFAYCKKKGYSATVTKELASCFRNNFNGEDVEDFFEDKRFFSKGEEIFPRDDQMNAVKRAILQNRCINLCPTSFGKSLCITMECLFFIEKLNARCLIIVPTKDLVNQFDNDIRDYASNFDGLVEEWYPKIQKIFYGQSREIDEDTKIVISTWQSLERFADKEFMAKFNLLILDECHNAKGKSISTIVGMAESTPYRTGWTGTLPLNDCDQTTIRAQFGMDKKIITTRQLMDKEIVAQLKINIVRLVYPQEVARDVCELNYHDQVDFIEKDFQRFSSIIKVIKDRCSEEIEEGRCKNTGLIFYRHIAHGEEIAKRLREAFPERNVYLIHGGYYTKNDKKFKNFEEIKPEIEKDASGIVVANYQLASTGISIKNLHWLMFASPLKSYISVLQSIGRGLRISNSKRNVLLLDMVDDFSYKKRSTAVKNYAMRHFEERFSIYNESQFDYSLCKYEVY